MVLGNFMLLCEFHPDEVYRWFMELFIDAYDWMMVPNVYGMSQFADGGIMATKPYISGSNYFEVVVWVFLSIAPCRVVVLNFRTTTFSSNSPSLKMLLMCS